MEDAIKLWIWCDALSCTFVGEGKVGEATISVSLGVLEVKVGSW